MAHYHIETAIAKRLAQIANKCQCQAAGTDHAPGKCTEIGYPMIRKGKPTMLCSRCWLPGDTDRNGNDWLKFQKAWKPL
jgi:hypothetical protein